MNSLNLPHFAILSGLFGTAASVFGKFISYSDELLENIPIDINQQELLWKWALKIVCILLMIACNAFVWAFFVKALHDVGSIIATVTSTATNYCCSALIGQWIFGEEISALWWLGSSFVLTGLVFVSLGSDERTASNTSNQHKDKQQ